MSTNTVSKKSSKKSTKSVATQSPTASVSPPTTTAASSPSTATALASTGVATPIGADTAGQCIALLAQVSNLLGPVTALSTKDKHRTLKLRKGGVTAATQILDLCTHHGIEGVGVVSVKAMGDALAETTALNQIGVELDALQKKLADAVFGAQSSAWSAATTLYTTLRRLALIDPTLANGLQPVQAFFQTKKTKGTKRSSSEASKLRAAEQVVAKASPASGASGATVNGAGTSAGVIPSGSNGATAVAPASNGVAHS